MRHTRRDILIKGSLLAAGLEPLARLQPAKAAAGPPAAADRVLLSLTLTLDGRTHRFAEEAAEDMGDYKGEFVHQRCFRATNPDLQAFTVWFRPDADGGREEVVVEYGHLWQPAEPAHILAPYTATVMKGRRSLASFEVPFHLWLSRWRWQSAPRPVLRPPAELTRRGWVPRFDPIYVYGHPPLEQHIWSGPMGTSGLATAMGMAGERPDIGLVTEWQADYLMTGNPQSLATLLAQGEACGSMPFHFRDEKTGRTLDIYQYPRAALTKHAGGPPVLAWVDIPKNPKTKWYDTRYFHVDSDHAPAAAFLPWALTDDPYFLEEMEGQASYNNLAYPSNRWSFRLPALTDIYDTRGFAWSMRTLFQLGIAAPEEPPRWLTPRVHWRKCIADNRQFVQRYMDSPARVHRLFRTLTRSEIVASWQSSFVAVTFAQALDMGYAEWKDAFEWFMGGLIPLCDGKSGWERKWPCPYYFSPLKDPTKHQFLWLVPDTNLDAETYGSWKEAWDAFAADPRNEVPQTNPETWASLVPAIKTKYRVGYCEYVRAVYAIGARHGIRGAKTCHDWLAPQLPSAFAGRSRGLGKRWAMV